MALKSGFSCWQFGIFHAVSKLGYRRIKQKNEEKNWRLKKDKNQIAAGNTGLAALLEKAACKICKRRFGAGICISAGGALAAISRQK
jgi:hypothetical protein